jgi:peptide deformylase
MNQLIRDFRILALPAIELKTKCSLVHFPLSQETEEDILYLRSCLRKNFGKVRTLGISAPQVGILKRIFIMPSNWEIIRSSHRLVPPSMLRKFDVFINPMVLEVSSETYLVHPTVYLG